MGEEKDNSIIKKAGLFAGKTEELSPEEQTILSRFIAITTSITSPRLKVYEKLTGEHITLFINHLENSNKREYQNKRETRRYIFGGFALFLALTFALAYIGKTEILDKLINYVMPLLIGLLGGYGYCKSKTS